MIPWLGASKQINNDCLLYLRSILVASQVSSITSLVRNITILFTSNFG